MLLFLILAQSIPLGAGPYLPAWAGEVLRPWDVGRAVASLVAVPDHVVDVVNRSRAGLIDAGGDTEIRLGASAESRTTPPSSSMPPSVADTPEARDVAPPSSESEPDVIENSEDPSRPDTAIEKVFVGTVAMFVPRAIAQPAGWIQIGGGRGLWAFADVDTVVFSVTLVGSLALIVMQHRRGFRPHPAFWGVLVLVLLIGVPLAYEGSNFGTMFRQRNMVMLEFLLLPVLMERGRPRRRDDLA
jgi:hypothetical protein